MTNSVGVIDSDYRGEVLASLMFNGAPGNCNEIDLPGGERIVQLLVVPIILPQLTVVDWSDEEWNDTQRGTGGFGSTGKN
jgi:dUTP pyrophosphatase